MRFAGRQRQRSQLRVLSRDLDLLTIEIVAGPDLPVQRQR